MRMKNKKKNKNKKPAMPLLVILSEGSVSLDIRSRIVSLAIDYNYDTGPEPGK